MSEKPIGFFRALLIVFRVFTAIGHRGPSLAEQGVKPQHLILAGLLAAALLVVLLVTLARLVLMLAR